MFRKQSRILKYGMNVWLTHQIDISRTHDVRRYTEMACKNFGDGIYSKEWVNVRNNHDNPTEHLQTARNRQKKRGVNVSTLTAMSTFEPQTLRCEKELAWTWEIDKNLRSARISSSVTCIFGSATVSIRRRKVERRNQTNHSQRVWQINNLVNFWVASTSVALSTKNGS